MRSKMMTISLIGTSLLMLGGCRSFFYNDPIVVSYQPPSCNITWEEEDRLELFSFLDSDLPSEMVFEKISEYRRYCNAMNDYILEVDR